MTYFVQLDNRHDIIIDLNRVFMRATAPLLAWSSHGKSTTWLTAGSNRTRDALSRTGKNL